MECKATNSRATSMKYVIANQKKYGVHPAVKYSDTNVGKGDGFDTCPLYALGFPEKAPEKNLVPVVDVSKLVVPT